MREKNTKKTRTTNKEQTRQSKQEKIRINVGICHRISYEIFRGT